MPQPSFSAPSASGLGCRWIAEHWSAYLTDDEPPEVVFFGPRCAKREFAAADEK
jgi:hypothetical protein